MKSTRFFLTVLAAAAATATAACEKTAVQVIDDPDAGHGANVKFFNFAVGSPQVNFFVNDRKTTAVSATGCAVLTDDNRAECLSTGRESTSGVAYGSSANGGSGWYSDVAAGQTTISGRIAAATDKNVAVASTSAMLDAGKFYSYYMSGIYDAAAKTADSFVVEDVLPPVDFERAYVRFVNASSTAQPMTLFVKDRTTQEEVAAGGLVAYKAAGAFTAVPAGSYDLAARTAGSTSNVFSRSQISFSAGRVYTITARGNTASSSTMFLDNTANR